MKTVFNWTVGSFFRSIGRIVAYLFIGGFIAYILNRSGFDWGRLIGIEKVSALSLNGTPRYQQQYHNTQVLLQDAYDTAHTIQVNFDTPFNSNADYAIFSIKGVQWYSAEDGAYGNPDNPTIYRDMVLRQFLNIQLKSTSGPWAPCEIQDSYLVCQINENITYNGFAVQADSLAITQGYSMKLNNYVWFYDKDSTSVENAIDQQTQQQQQQYNDTNSTSESNTASDYFHNQSDDTPSGLTSAITSPLRILDNAIQGNHSDLCFTLNSKQTCIPSGDIIWGGNLPHNTNHWFDSGYANPKTAFVNLFNIVVAGYLCYKMLLSMMRIFNNAIDPTVTKIEVMKL